MGQGQGSENRAVGVHRGKKEFQNARLGTLRMEVGIVDMLGNNFLGKRINLINIVKTVRIDVAGLG